MDLKQEPKEQPVITPRYALYNADAMDVLTKMPKESVHLSIYSPPFALESGGALYHYSSSERDLSNSRTYKEFFKHYEFIVKELSRVTLPGRMSCVHCMDVPSGNTGCDHYTDFPGDIIRLHEKHGMKQASPRITIWKEPLAVRNRTMTKSLAHKTIVEDSCDCAVAGADYILVFRKKGQNKVPVTHERGLMRYAGEKKLPAELLRYRGWTGNQIENRYSHWIWRQYASSVWNDIRGNTGSKTTGVLPFKQARDERDEKHLHPLQLDVIERLVTLWSNRDEIVVTPFMGVGSEAYGAVRNGRRAVGSEIKPSYFRQAVKHLTTAETVDDSEQTEMFAEPPSCDSTDEWMLLAAEKAARAAPEGE